VNQAIGHVWRIARLTFLEAVRQRFFNFLILLAVALVGSSYFFRQFNFGASELRFIADFGLGGIFLFGSILSVVAAAQLFFSEIENRTALTILAKPVRRWSFIAGKFLGVALLMFVFIALLTTLLGLCLWWRERQLIVQWGDQFPPSEHVRYWALAFDGLLQWLKFDVLVAVTILIASFANTNLYTVIVSFFVQLICQLQYIANDRWSGIKAAWARPLVWLLGKVFPNFQLFSIGDLAIFPQKVPIPHTALLAAAGYAAIYIVVFLALAVFSFSQREI
jgi:ABC-2 type transport system permease protein